METYVEMNLEHVLDEIPNVCRCEQCRADIKALVLNRLRPMYVSTSKGEALSMMQAFDTGKQVEFLCCARSAAALVTSNPHH
ncbi:MAG: late competence development ComFB family protein [Anaerovibrio sp.]|nr:late competence development ComFB family protein [Anaerovibrio sp.]